MKVHGQSKFRLLLGQRAADKIDRIGFPQRERCIAPEKQMFCDWTALHFGGYGKSIACPDGVTTLDGPTSQAQCVSRSPTNCAVTVTQAEQCMKDTSCSDPVPASCAGLFNCQ